VYDIVEELNLSPENVQDDEFAWKVVEKERNEVENVVIEGYVPEKEIEVLENNMLAWQKIWKEKRKS